MARPSVPTDHCSDCAVRLDRSRAFHLFLAVVQSSGRNVRVGPFTPDARGLAAPAGELYRPSPKRAQFVARDSQRSQQAARYETSPAKRNKGWARGHSAMMLQEAGLLRFARLSLLALFAEFLPPLSMQSLRVSFLGTFQRLGGLRVFPGYRGGGGSRRRGGCGGWRRGSRRLRERGPRHHHRDESECDHFSKHLHCVNLCYIYRSRPIVSRLQPTSTLGFLSDGAQSRELGVLGKKICPGDAAAGSNRRAPLGSSRLY